MSLGANMFVIRYFIYQPHLRHPPHHLLHNLVEDMFKDCQSMTHGLEGERQPESVQG
jgi:hypothetical protein